MKWFYFKTIPKTLNWLILIAFIFLFLINKLPESFTGASELKIASRGIFGSIIASYIFYLVVVHFKKVSDKRVIYPYISKWAQIIIKDLNHQLAAFTKKISVELSLRNITKDKIQEAFSKINPYDKAPLIFLSKKYANWLQYLKHNRDHSRQYISKIMSQLIFLEASLVDILTKIDDSTHFLTIDIKTRITLENKDMGAFANEFFDYCMACKELDCYLQSHIINVK